MVRYSPLKRCFSCAAIIVILHLTTASFASGAGFRAKVMQVKDGDTIVIKPLESEQFLTCRLHGIDAPETFHPRFGMPGQRFGEEAAKELKKLIMGEIVEITTMDARSHNREICIVKKEGLDVNLAMIKRGYAWAYRRHLSPPYASNYMKAEREARKKKLGLWRDTNPNPPWEFRTLMRGK